MAMALSANARNDSIFWFLNKTVIYFSHWALEATPADTGKTQDTLVTGRQVIKGPTHSHPWPVLQINLKHLYI